MLMGTHAYAQDERNADILIYVNGDIVPRREAKISVFDSGFLLGDGIWEGLRLHNGKLAFWHDHVDRLFAGAAAIGLDIGMGRNDLHERVMKTVQANAMTSGVHIRLIVTRGEKITPYQHPAANVGGPTIVIIPEYKTANKPSREEGLRLLTVHVRRGYPDVQDPRLNSLSKLNCITACIQAANAGFDEALMLDPHGFVSTCNSTNFFIVRHGEVWTSTGNYCMNGITRAKIVALCRENDIPIHQQDFSLVDVYSADEVFVTGTFGGAIPVREVDGRTIVDRRQANILERLQQLYTQLIESECSGD